jgi:hypothetical protein
MHTSGASRREIAESYLDVIARSKATKQSTLSLHGEMDCFAALAMTTRFGFPVNGGTAQLRLCPPYEAYANVASTFPSPFNSITTLSPALSQIVFTRLPVSTISPARRPLPSAARWLASQASAL